jgi:integrase
MANTGLRPDEALRLQFRDVSIINDDATHETILLIKVRGKRGVGNCKSMPNAVRPFTRLRDRKRAAPIEHDAKNMALPKPDDLLFPGSQHELLNNVLIEEGLKFDREGRARTAYSLRHTYICFRLLEGADIYQVAKNCRTSVEMIQKYYASHIETDLDAAAINVLKSRKFLIDEDEDQTAKNQAKRKPKAMLKLASASRKRFGKSSIRLHYR